MKIERLKQTLGDQMLVLIIVLLCVLGAVFTDSFLTPYNIKILLYSMTVYGFLSLGQSMVMLVSELNLTQGSLICFAPTFGMFLTQKIMKLLGRNILVGGNYIVDGLVLYMILTLLTGMAIGFLMGCVIVRFNVSSLVVTLGMMYTLGGLVFFQFSGYSLYFNRLEGANWLGTAEFLEIPVSVLLLAFVSGALILLMKYTKMGRYIYATGGNERAAIYAGVSTKKWKIIAFTISGTLASISGLIFSSRVESIDPVQGVGYQMFALAIAVVGGVSMEGGRGTLVGTLLATTIVALVFNVMSLFKLYSWYQTMFIGAIIVIAAIQQAANRKSLV
ncbi:MAG: ABC transporter permease [Synergistaceae bacterium]|jgi:ribose/xylose/arabinose/galactoside ABC-type transport system permease subunit|nr:ABC transporter permease [Synergistaceae bacterium]